MTRTTHTGQVILAIVVVFTLYFMWSAFESSHCVSVGIERQTRTTWAPFDGCTAVDDYQKPWSVFAD